MSRTQHSGVLFSLAQRIGRSLMLPIAALPIAAVMLRLGQPDMLGAAGLGQWIPLLNAFAALLRAAGEAVIANLPLLFAIGVAIGYARGSDGSTALAAVIAFLTFQAINKTMSPYILGRGAALTPQQIACLHRLKAGDRVQRLAMSSSEFCHIGNAPLIDYGVFGGIIIGVVTAILWQRYHRFRLPSYLAFFSGRRFVPIVAAAAAIPIGLGMSFIYPIFNKVINQIVGSWLLEPGNDVIGGFVFGTTSRLLIPFGLHHILNAVPWLAMGTCTNAAGVELHGEISCFFDGVPGSFNPPGYVPGAYMTGFFPIMLGGLLGAALAMYRTVPPHRRQKVKALLLSGALTSFLTGVTEPLEFSFAYAAAPLYVLHALLTGSSLAITNWLGIRDGFSFSAGIFDYILNFTRSAQLSREGIWGPILLLVIAVVYFLIYYFIFSFAIRFFNIPTPGREDESLLETSRARALVTNWKRARKVLRTHSITQRYLVNNSEKVADPGTKYHDAEVAQHIGEDAKKDDNDTTK